MFSATGWGQTVFNLCGVNAEFGGATCSGLLGILEETQFFLQKPAEQSVSRHLHLQSQKGICMWAGGGLHVDPSVLMPETKKFCVLATLATCIA